MWILGKPGDGQRVNLFLFRRSPGSNHHECGWIASFLDGFIQWNIGTRLRTTISVVMIALIVRVYISKGIQCHQQQRCVGSGKNSNGQRFSKRNEAVFHHAFAAARPNSIRNPAFQAVALSLSLSDVGDIPWQITLGWPRGDSFHPTRQCSVEGQS